MAAGLKPAATGEMGLSVADFTLRHGHTMDSKYMCRVLVAIGGLLLLAGVAFAYLGPLEMVCFTYFSAGGRFAYEGFGFGSFMFGNITAQIIGYYTIAAVLIPLGYGHLRLRRWARTLALALTRVWLVVGLPVIAVTLVVLVASKEPSLVGVVIVVLLLALSYLVVPAVVVIFYNTRSVRATFEASDPTPDGVSDLSVQLLTLCILYLFTAVVLHIPIFFRGSYPFFGVFLFDLPGIALLDGSILLLLLLAWGTSQRHVWAWWGALIIFGLLASSTILTCVRTDYLELLAALRFPPAELEFLDGVPLQGFHLALFFGLPLVAMLGVAAASRRHFGRNRRIDQ